MTAASNEAKCPSCGMILPQGSLGGLCPACLLKAGADTQSASIQAPVSQCFEPPSIEKLAALFPQLEILNLIGAGGMGAVYKARQPALDRLVALKILPPGASGGVNFAERFNREARALARLSHPNIVTVHEFGQVGDLHFFIMEYVDGANLRRLEKSGRLSPREALEIIPQICDALQYAHDEGVVHRDIKPENVLVDRKGRVKIADFGLAKILGLEGDRARLTAEGQVMGTPHYMAPEQVERPLTVDHRADIYSLGVVFYEMLTGDLPIGKFAPPSRKVEVDVRLDEIVLRALENDPARRYQKVSEVKQRVETVVETPAATATPLTPGDEEKNPAPKTGARYLRWAGIPVVVERDDEREVNFQGAIGVFFVMMLCSALGQYTVRWITGTEHATAQLSFVAGVLASIWAIRRTMNKPWDDEVPRRTEDGTVILPPRKRLPYLADCLMVVGLFAAVVGSHYLKTFLLRGRTGGERNGQLAHQTAEPQPATGTLIAKLPGGGAVELVALSQVGAAPNQWWRPNGSLVTDATFEVHNPVETRRADRRSFNVVLRRSDLPAGADGPFYESEPAGNAGSGGEVYLNGKPAYDLGQSCFSWAPDVHRATIRVGFGIEPWRTISTHDPNNHRTSFETKPDAPRWDVNVHGYTDGKEGAQITLVMDQERRDWRSRVIAIDSTGTEHTHRMASGTPGGTAAIWTYSFPGLALKDVKEFRVQVRPVYWTAFPEVKLEPDSPLPSPEPLRLSGVNEFTFDGLIDFDSGRTAGFPPGVAAGAPFESGGTELRWAEDNGFDAVVRQGELQVFDMDFSPLNNADWDTMGPQEVINRLHQSMFHPRTLGPLKKGEFPSTYAYRTREHGYGMIQIVSLETTRPGARVRLRQLVRPGTNTPVVAQRDPQSGELVAALPGGGSMALVALKSAASSAWFFPDGTPASGFDFSVNYTQRLSAVEARLFDLVFRLQGLPESSMVPTFEFARAVRSSTGGELLVRDHREDSLLPVQVVWPLVGVIASARVGVPRAPWHTIGGYEPVSRSYSRTRTGDDPKWEVLFHAAGDGAKGAQVTVVFGTNYPGWNLRVMARRSRDADVLGVIDGTVTQGSVTTRTYVFPGLRFADVVNFQVQAQPLLWVEFPGIALEPRALAYGH